MGADVCVCEGVCDVGQVMQEQEAPVLALFGQLVEIHWDSKKVTMQKEEILSRAEGLYLYIGPAGIQGTVF